MFARSARRSTSGQLLVLAGPMGAGKTTLARELSRVLNWPVASTSAYIAKVASENGLTPTRSVIQAVGMDLVARDVAKFAALFLKDGGWSPGSALIVDSARQNVLYSALIKSVAPSPARLVFVQAPFAIRAQRVAAREGMTAEELRGFDDHPVETEVPRLRYVADLVLSGLNETHDLALRIVRWL